MTFVLISLLLLLMGCSSGPKKFTSTKTKGQWSGQIIVKDLAENKEDALDFDAIADKRWGARIDLTAALGTAVGSLSVNDKSVRLIVVPRKKFYRGRPVAKTMKPLIGFSLDPKLLNAFLFDTLPAKGWECSLDEAQRPEKCVNKSESAKLSWTDREGEFKTVRFSNKRFSLILIINEFESEVDLRQAQFILTPPKGYRVYRVR